MDYKLNLKLNLTYNISKFNISYSILKLIKKVFYYI